MRRRTHVMLANTVGDDSNNTTHRVIDEAQGGLVSANGEQILQVLSTSQKQHSTNTQLVSMLSL